MGIDSIRSKHSPTISTTGFPNNSDQTEEQKIGILMAMLAMTSLQVEKDRQEMRAFTAKYYARTNKIEEEINKVNEKSSLAEEMNKHNNEFIKRFDERIARLDETYERLGKSNISTSKDIQEINQRIQKLDKVLLPNLRDLDNKLDDKQEKIVIIEKSLNQELAGDFKEEEKEESEFLGDEAESIDLHLQNYERDNLKIAFLELQDLAFKPIEENDETLSVKTPLNCSIGNRVFDHKSPKKTEEVIQPKVTNDFISINIEEKKKICLTHPQ